MCGKEKKIFKETKTIIDTKERLSASWVSIRDTDEELKGQQLSMGKQPGLVENGLLKHTGSRWL